MVKKCGLNWNKVQNLMAQGNVKEIYKEIGKYYLSDIQAMHIGERMRELLREYYLSFYNSEASIAIRDNVNDQDVRSIRVIDVAYNMLLYVWGEAIRDETLIYENSDSAAYEPNIIFAFRTIVKHYSCADEKREGLRSKLSRIEKRLGDHDMSEEWYYRAGSVETVEKYLSDIFGINVCEKEQHTRDCIFLLYFKYQKIISRNSRKGEGFFILMEEDRGIDYYLNQ